MFDDESSFQWAKPDAALGHGSVATQLILPAVQEDVEAGVFSRLASSSSTPEMSGCRAMLDKYGEVKFFKADTLVASSFIAGFDPFRRHDLRLITEPFGTQSQSIKKAKVYVDGRLAVSYANSVSIPGLPALANFGLCSSFQSANDSPVAFDEFRAAPAAAPYVTAFPLELNASAPTELTFTIDDQDFVPDLDVASFTLTIDVEGGCAIAGIEGTYTLDQLSVSGLGTNFTYEHGKGSAATSTWVSFDFGFDLETIFAACTDATHPADRLTFTLSGQDLGGNRVTRVFRYDR
jgi:hypothetical protein